MQNWKKPDYWKFFNLLKFLGQMQSSNTMTAEAVDKDIPEQSSSLQDWNNGGINPVNFSPPSHGCSEQLVTCILREHDGWWISEPRIIKAFHEGNLRANVSPLNSMWVLMETNSNLEIQCKMWYNKRRMCWKKINSTFARLCINQSVCI